MLKTVPQLRSSEPFVELLRKPLHSPVYSCKWQWWPLEGKAFLEGCGLPAGAGERAALPTPFWARTGNDFGRVKLTLIILKALFHAVRGSPPRAGRPVFSGSSARNSCRKVQPLRGMPVRSAVAEILQSGPTPCLATQRLAVTTNTSSGDRPRPSPLPSDCALRKSLHGS